MWVVNPGAPAACGLCVKAAKASSMKANPVQLPDEVLKRVLEESL